MNTPPHIVAPNGIRLSYAAQDGRYEISCPKGLWAVSGTDLGQVIREAMHYYRQYASDGEYDQL